MTAFMLCAAAAVLIGAALGNGAFSLATRDHPMRRYPTEYRTPDWLDWAPGAPYVPYAESDE